MQHETIEQVKDYIFDQLPIVLEKDPRFVVLIESIVAEKFPHRDEVDRRLDELQELRISSERRWRELHSEMNRRFEQTDRHLDQVDKRLEQVDKRLDQMDKRLEQVDKRLDRMDERLEQVDKRLEQIDKHLKQVDKRLDQMDKRLEQIDKHLEQVDKRLDRMDKRLEQVDKHLEQVDKRLDRMDKHLEQMDKRLEQGELRMDRMEQEMKAGFQEVNQRFEQVDQRFEQVDQRFDRLENDMKNGFHDVHVHIDRLGSRWGIRNEKLFRQIMKEILEQSMGMTVEERFIGGEQFDCIISNGQHILIEIAASVGPKIQERLIRKRQLYIDETGITPHRFLLAVGSIHSRRAEALRAEGFEVIEPEE